MQGHFSVINKRGLITVIVLLLISILLFSASLAKRLGGGSMIWLIPLLCGIILFLLCLMILMAVINAGVDVANGQVVFATPDGNQGKQPRFALSELKEVELRNADGVIEHPETDSLVGGRIVFILESGQEFVYYPITITARQYRKIRDGLFTLKAKI